MKLEGIGDLRLGFIQDRCPHLSRHFLCEHGGIFIRYPFAKVPNGADGGNHPEGDADHRTEHRRNTDEGEETDQGRKDAGNPATFDEKVYGWEEYGDEVDHAILASQGSISAAE
jgi:hypothetical protein